MDQNIVGKDINDKTVCIGDFVSLNFPYTKTVCEVKQFQRGVFPDSKFQTIYGDWLKHCEKKEKR